MHKPAISLSVRYIFFVVVVILATLGASSYVSIKQQYENEYAHFKEKGALLANVVSLVSVESIFAFDFFKLNSDVKEITDQSNVVYCAIVDREGKYLTDYLDLSDPIIKALITEGNSVDIKLIVSEINRLDNIIPIEKSITYDSQVVGKVLMGVSTSHIEEYTKSLIMHELLYAFVMITVLSVLMFVIFKKSALNRINELIASSERVSEGNLDSHVLVKNRDELGRLGLAFNAMLDNLQNNIAEKEKALRKVVQFNKSLEVEVRHRTEELQQMNEELLAQQAELEGHRDHLQDLIDEKTKDLVHAKDVAEQANHAKSEFLANMSHELRTPIHAILSFSRMGQAKIDLVEKERLIQYFEKTELSGDRLLRLVNNLLDLAKLEAGHTTLNYKNLVFIEVVNHVVSELEVICSEKGVKIIIHNLVDQQEIQCDEEKVEQVIRNLLSNAIKFSEAGSSIDVFVNRDKKGKRIVCSVKDSGMGIPKEELNTVFDKFIQSSKTKNGAGGTGLGLAISKDIIELHEGKIFAEETQKGAKLTFELPVTHPLCSRL